MKNNPQKLSPEELEKLVHRELRALPPRQAPAGFEARFQAKLAAREAQAALSPEKLEHLVHRELRALPLRPAPRTLEARVFAAIEARNSIPWWHKSWSYWPMAMRAVFAAIATIFAGAGVAGCYALFSGADATAATAAATERLGIFVQLYHAATWIFDFAAYLLASIPPLWLYGGLAFAATMYVALFGLGAAAYRTLYRSN
ncbi:MAG: hypothetical protein C0518_10675 [Opitutus sp.]|nr:hypothetical protein [Opitutus sp.]